MSEKKPRGFAAMSEEKRKEVGSKGGKSAQKKGKAHRFQAGQEAREAGRKGGKATQARKKKEQ